MKAVELVRHQLSMAVRVDDHFSGVPWPHELDVSLDIPDRPVRVQGGASVRHADGTYRFIGLPAGPRQITVAAKDGTAFTWDPMTNVVLPLADPRDPVVIEMWPAPSARVSPGGITIRGRLVIAGAGQEIEIRTVGVVPPRIRRSRCDATGELTFVVVGPVALNADGLVELDVTVPGRTLTSIQILDGDTDPTFPGPIFPAPPGREIRVLFNLT